jgi:hypothetical protein
MASGAPPCCGFLNATRNDAGSRRDTTRRPDEYVIVLQPPDGVGHQDRFQTAVAFHRRLLALEAQLEAERWRAKSPVVLPEGWPDRTPSAANHERSRI